MKRLGLTLALLFLLPFHAKAQLNWIAVDFFNLSGGLNNAFDPTAIAPNEAADLQNVVFTTGGTITKRSGFTPINSPAISSTAVFTGLAFYKQADGDRFLVSLVSDGATDRIYSMAYGTGTSGPDGTWANRTGSLVLAFGNDDQGDFATAQDILVIEDGISTTAPYRWNGTGNAVALGGTPPNATMVEYHKRHLALAGQSTNPSRVYFSNLDDIETWTSTDFITVETDDGQIIRALKSALDCLYIFKDESIWRMCGTDRDNFTLEQMVRGIGTRSNQSIAVINNQLFFMTSQGDIAVYDGGLTVQVISTKIEGTITGLNRDRFDNAIAVAFDDGTGDEDYYVSVSAAGAGTHNRILLFDTFHRAWTVFVGLNANAMAVYELGTLQKALAFGNYAGVANRYPNADSDTGTAINAFWMSPQLSFAEQVPQEKTFRLIQTFVNQKGNYNLNGEYRVDFEATGTAFTVSLAGTGAVWNTARFDTDAYADLTTTIGRTEIYRGNDFLQVRYSNANATEPFTIKGFRIWLEPTGRIGGIT